MHAHVPLYKAKPLAAARGEEDDIALGALKGKPVEVRLRRAMRRLLRASKISMEAWAVPGLWDCLESVDRADDRQTRTASLRQHGADCAHLNTQAATRRWPSPEPPERKSPARLST